MPFLRSLVLLGSIFATFAGLPAHGSEASHLMASPTVAMRHPKQVGGSVSAPTLIHVVPMPGLIHMDQAIVLSFWVETDGVPSHIRVVQGGDPAQNDKIVSAVQQYRFQPAMENDKPVLVEMDMALDVD